MAKRALSRWKPGVFVGRFLAVLLLWWVLAEGQTAALAPGAVVGVLVAGFSTYAFSRPRYRLRWRALPGFVVFFIGHSVVAGLDVARRLLMPSMPIAPGMVAVTLAIPAGAPRWLLANTLSLLPGTLSVELNEDQLEVHCLDAGGDIAGSVHDTESRVAELFGLPTEVG